MLKFEAKKEQRKLKAIVKSIPVDKQKLAEGLIAQASFMAEELEKLQDYITEHGWSEGYQNGANQFGKKQSTEASTYIQIQKNYTSVIRQLNAMMDVSIGEKKEAAGEEFAKALKKGRKYNVS